MSFSILAKHAQGKEAKDVIFAASDAANKAVEQHGKANVINATIGSIFDDNEAFVCLPTVEKVFKSLTISDVAPYGGIAGLPKYLEAVIDETCGKSRPNAHMAALATPGGAGVLHHAIWNYSEEGDKILTSDWYWDAYSSFCRDMVRGLCTYEMFDENKKYNINALESKIRELLETQENAVVIINTPAHNPVGYSVSNEEWDEILKRVKQIITDTQKKVILVVDMAYIDYAGEREEVRSFVKKFENLPKELLVILGYSMSKGFTLYGQRAGAMIGISSDEEVIKEFKNANQYSCRATWSNINRGCMQILVNICSDNELHDAVCQERASTYEMIKKRADIFSKEAKEVGLEMVPYVAGFFISINAKDSAKVCEELKKDLIFAVPLAKGVRIAVCSVPLKKMQGLAAKVKKAFDAIEK